LAFYFHKTPFLESISESLPLSHQQLSDRAVHPATGYAGLEGKLLYSVLNRGPIWGCGMNATLRPLYPRERNPLPITHESG